MNDVSPSVIFIGSAKTPTAFNAFLVYYLSGNVVILVIGSGCAYPKVG
jgi:hypothetical protein